MIVIDIRQRGKQAAASEKINTPSSYYSDSTL
jgi:hypothetical protein